MANRLVDATSPYLLQHKNNPVDWWEWGPEAFAEAERRNVPILLSVGYAACHWCHVMAHESFEDADTAAQLNAGFVSIKVDREERPDVDARYMQATIAMTGSGGWPMTVFLTPQGKVFQAGTYYPPTPRHQMPSFRQLLQAVSQAWQERRDDLEQAAQRITAAISTARPDAPVGSHPPTSEDLERAVRTLAGDHDEQRGGFGGAPKFPPSMVLEWLLRHAARVGTTDPAGTGATALDMAQNTLRHMAYSGIYDQIEGGFARYSVDAEWIVPHFEKMLYDNALLARVYLHWWRLTGDPLGRRIALETCGWMVQRLGTDEGGLASALDADTAVEGSTVGVEGLTYVWTPAQLVEVLGPHEGEWFAAAAGVSADGTFEHGTSTVRVLVDIDDPSGPDGPRWQHARALLHEARAARPQPMRDDKVVTAWNGLAIAALAEAGALLDRADLLQAAQNAADLLLRVHRVDGRLRRASRLGRAGEPSATLDDHANLIEGLLALFASTGHSRWAHAAGELADDIVVRFRTPRGTLSDVPLDVPDPLLHNVFGEQPADPGDNAEPSGNSAAAGALLAWAAMTADQRYQQVADHALDVVRRVAGGSPRFAGWGLAVAEANVDGPRQVAVVGAEDDPRTQALRAEALRATAPGLVLALGAPQPEQDAGVAVPLLAERGLVAGAPAAYPCRGMVCDLPVMTPQDLRPFTRPTRAG